MKSDSFLIMHRSCDEIIIYSDKCSVESYSVMSDYVLSYKCLLSQLDLGSISNGKYVKNLKIITASICAGSCRVPFDIVAYIEKMHCTIIII